MVVKAKKVFLIEKRLEWLIIFLRDIGAALIVGVILAGIVGELEWMLAVVMLFSALALCYISFVLINPE